MRRKCCEQEIGLKERERLNSKRERVHQCTSGRFRSALPCAVWFSRNCSRVILLFFDIAELCASVLQTHHQRAADTFAFEIQTNTEALCEGRT